MKIRSFKDHLEKRLNKAEIAEIEETAKVELTELNKTNGAPNLSSPHQNEDISSELWKHKNNKD